MPRARLSHLQGEELPWVQGGSGRVAGLHVLCCADREPSSPAAALQLCLSQPCLQWLKFSLNLNLLYPSETGKVFLIGLNTGQNSWKLVVVSVISSAS